MKFGTVKKIGALGKPVFLIFLLAGLLSSTGFADENPIPWAFGGYQNVNELYIKYLFVEGEAFSDIQNFKKESLGSEISELWFSKNPPRLRIDRYVESTPVRCNQFKGKEWEKITYEGKTYVLKERIMQINTKRTTFDLQNISSGGGVELCEYKRFENTTSKPASLGDALGLLPVIPYIAEPETKEIVISTVEMDEMLNPERYKETLSELKKRYEKAGRQTAKWDTGHGIIKFSAKGYAFIDLEWGIGLEGYLTEGREAWGRESVTFEKPVCIYKVVGLETKIPDPNVFNKWVD